MTKNLSEAFQCWYCEQNLLNTRYVIRDDFAICLLCFEEKYSHYCYKCQARIGIEMPGKTFQNQTWHDTCFNCSMCEGSLINQKFAYQNETLYCRSCFINQYAERCFRCNRSLQPNEKCIEYERKLYHQSCFVCHACEEIISNENFHRRNQYFLCLSCHLHLVAIYCIKCHKAITNDGIIYHNYPFHQECFLCTYCLIPLRNQRYFEHENEAYCSSCVRKLFRK